MFWNIFKGIPCSNEFKDLFEKISRKEPEERLSMKEIMSHKWLEGEKMTEQELREEIMKKFEVVEKTSCMDLGSLNHEKSFGYLPDEETNMKEMEEF